MCTMGSEDDFPSAADCFYTSHYCEENVWKLCELISQKKSDFLDHCHCVFVSNDSKVTPLWHQKVGSGDDFFVAWDYHVFLVCKSAPFIKVYDFDTTLGFPVSFSDYMEKAIGLETNMVPKYRRFFRVIPASEYLKYFSSDRRHMKKANGDWLKPPPPYDPIQSNGILYHHSLNQSTILMSLYL
ncbi:protein N-terminal glutamine amidohydrolase isoform X2 [Halyomorpha halys]|uniref:protein N-terminal glutamine amidohydrolase isoform X2 n=1 Tax=Halyomorpha halys TaxID=286706 RepID=UPI0006D4F352